MNLTEAITQVCDSSGINRNIGSVYDRVVREINRVSSDIWDSYAWSFRWKNYRFVTDTDYTTGTITATNGSRSLTGSGTAFASTHLGWHISFDADSPKHWYKLIAIVSGTSVIMDVPYQGTTGGSKAFTLRHFDYTLPTEVWDLGSLSVTSDRTPIDILEPSSLDLIGPTPETRGYPIAVSFYGADSTYTRYNTGSISGTQQTQVMTGNGTAFLGNVQPGDTIWLNAFGDTTSYTIRSVDSDTQLTLYNFQNDTSSSVSYVITRQLSRVMRVLWPSDQHYVIDIRALRKYSNLFNTLETNELLHRYPDMVVKKVSAVELASQGDLRSRELAGEAELALQKAKAEDESLTKRNNVAPIFTYRGRGYAREW